MSYMRILTKRISKTAAEAVTVATTTKIDFRLASTAAVVSP